MSGRGGRGGRGGPAFSGRTGGGRITSLQARDAAYGGGRGGGRGGKGKWKKPLNGNYIASRDGQGGSSRDENNTKLLQAQAEDKLEATLGFPLFTSGEDKLGWLMNMQPSVISDKDSGQVASAVDCYFMCQDGTMFKARMTYAPYFYVQVVEGTEFEAEGFLRRKFEGHIKDVEIVSREDLDLKNHLSGLQRQLLKLSFWNVSSLVEVRKEIQPAVTRNRARAATTQAYQDMQAGMLMQQGQGHGGSHTAAAGAKDLMDVLMDMREYDVPYHVRFAIDLDIRCGHWYTVQCQGGATSMTRRTDLLQRAEPRICAWDIETTKLPLQFPNAEYDQVFMISYMLDRQGYLITNREVVGQDVTPFEFTPKPEFEGPFIIHNEPNEEALLTRFFNHMREVKPAIFVTYNGDFFDFPFVEKRAKVHGMDLYEQLGFRTASSGEVLARHAVHMDCLHWVNRDSYLPQGSRGLKAVTKAKLGYDPVEVAPEDMLGMAREDAQGFASYSVSDAVSTYYLYMTYIHPFIFSLATIIPMPPDEVLRKGSGTLCEQLLMVQAYQKSIVCPNKHTSQSEVFYKGHLLESETYIGGKVEALESGVFRADLPLRFRCNSAAYQGLIDRLDKDLGYAIQHDANWKVEDVGNYEEVKAAITAQLAALRDTPNRDETPMIYHLDVAAMYPNIILTNRLQPSAIVNDEDCAACCFNSADKTCLRQMEWVWRGEHFAATRNEYLAIKNQLQAETFPPAPVPASAAAAAAARGEPLPAPQPRSWDELSQEEKDKLLRDRLKKYTQKVYKRVLDKPIQELRIAGICQRENSFYVDTVRAFRDRRYEYKGLNKTWKGKLEAAKASGDALNTAAASDMVVLYDSLQLAHKCILNSFYGYVMRKGARWYSMEMAGVVTYTGANIIKRACALVSSLGRPLELDTDGIWCALPSSFPETYKLKNNNGKVFKLDYPCVMLNVMVADHNTNSQYQTLVDPVTRTYAASSEMSIEFEVDGPYKAMILPASKEEGKSIKKRYAVFNLDGSLAELKGFEMKRRGELKLIKVFQSEVFGCFLEGSTLEQCYAAVAAVANRWLDMLDTQGSDLTDEELIDHISEATTMSKGLEEYEGRKSCPVTCAKRLGQFLGDERIKDKGLNCQYVIARKPENQPTSERAIPVSIFSAAPAVARTYLRQWCGDVGSAPTNCVPDVRDIVDWQYYRERLASAIQKIITIPAAMQGVANPCPRVKHPDWLQRKVASLSSRSHQLCLTDMFAKLPKKQADNTSAPAADGAPEDADMEDVIGNKLVPREAAAETPGCHAEGSEADADEGPVQIGARRTRRRSAVVIGSDDETGEQENLHPNKGQPAQQQAGQAGPQQAANAAGVTGKEVVAAGPKPQLRQGYKAWMAHQKGLWRQGHEQRKRRRVEAAAAAKAAGGRAVAAVETTPGRADVGRILRQQAAAITQVAWQVLHLAETNTPGRFKLWFLANGSVQHVTLTVPRTLYIDSEDHLDTELLTRCAARAQAGAAAGPDANVQLGSLVFTQNGSEVTPSSQLLGELAKVPGLMCVKAGNKTLPGGRKAANLYKVTLNEDSYLEYAEALSAALSAPIIRAVYEEQLPLAMHASLVLGSVTRLTPAATSKSLNGDFTLEDFKAAAAAESHYLEARATPTPGTALLLGQQGRQVEQADGGALLGPHLKHIVLYSSGDSSQGRAFTAMFMPSSHRCLVVVVNSATSAPREVTTHGLERLWRDTLAQAGPGTAGLTAGMHIDFTVEYVEDALDAGRVLQRALGSHRAEQRGRGLCAVQATVSWRVLASSWLPALADCPCVDLPAIADDSRYPALQWQARAARRAIAGVVDSLMQVGERVTLARYASVPLASLGADMVVSVADMQLARSLRSAEHLLWVKDATLPDLGVEDKEDGDAQLASMVTGLGACVSDPTSSTGSGSNAAAGATRGGGQAVGGWGGASPELLAPGAYRCVCVELKVYHLAVAALMQAEALGDLEGAASVEGAGGAAGPAFKVLKGLVNGWLQEATTNNNFVADAQLRGLYRWLSYPGSALYDPALQRALQGVMAKLFAQLVSEMRKLGAVLVCANFNTMVIATGKTELAAAEGYIRYLLEALKRRDMFWLVEMSPNKWWHALLYRDRYNWAGIRATTQQQQQQQSATPAAGPSYTAMVTPGKAPHRTSQSGATPLARRDRAMQGDQAGQEGMVVSPAVDIQQEPTAPPLEYQWSLAAFLPSALQPALEELMLEYLYLPWKEAQKHKAGAARAKQKREQAQERGEEQGGSGEGAGEEQREGVKQSEQDVQLAWLETSLPTTITQHLLEVTQEASRLMPIGTDKPEYQFPQLAGSHLTQEELGSPALAFVRLACHLLGLDARLSDAVAVIRRQLLRCLHVREFSPEADFKELCLALTLPDVICSVCNECRDLDLCRDAELAAQGAEGTGWRCKNCGQSYDMHAMEQRLISAIQHHVRDYQTQDLQCVRCQAVSSSHLRSGCARCGAGLRTTTSSATIHKRLVVFRSVAQHHGFPALEQLADWLLTS